MCIIIIIVYSLLFKKYFFYKLNFLFNIKQKNDKTPARIYKAYRKYPTLKPCFKIKYIIIRYVYIQRETLLKKHKFAFEIWVSFQRILHWEDMVPYVQALRRPIYLYKVNKCGDTFKSQHNTIYIVI